MRRRSSTAAALGQKLAAANLSLWTDMQRHHRIETSAALLPGKRMIFWGFEPSVEVKT
ncbi:hypothetical protein P365_16595 [Comamonas thiooxydans]|nr:hypothetical protein P365_16595 [Comamonas thiooxydans]